MVHISPESEIAPGNLCLRVVDVSRALRKSLVIHAVTAFMAIGFSEPSLVEAQQNEPKTDQVPVERTSFARLVQLDEADGPDEPTSLSESNDDADSLDTETSDNRSDEPLGQPPPDNSLQFLRGETVLLKPGDIQLEYGFFYSTLQNRFVEPDGFGGLVEVESIDRSLVAPLTMRVGLSEDIQLSGTVPVGFSYVEIEDPFFEEQSTLFTVGDIVLGANAILGRGNDEAPDILGGLNFIIPTDDGRSGVGGLQPALGSGFFGVGWNLTAIRSYDPAVFFASVGHTHLFKRHLSGGEVQPGEFIDYSFGMSFAINDEVTLNGEVIGGFQFDTEFDGVEIPNSSNEPISLRLSVIRTVTPEYFIEPSLQFGLTDDASTVLLGVSFTRSPPS